MPNGGLLCGTADDVPVLQQQGGVLPDGAAALRRRADDLLLQVHQMQTAVEGVVGTAVAARVVTAAAEYPTSCVFPALGFLLCGSAVCVRFLRGSRVSRCLRTAVCAVLGMHRTTMIFVKRGFVLHALRTPCTAAWAGTILKPVVAAVARLALCNSTFLWIGGWSNDFSISEFSVFSVRLHALELLAVFLPLCWRGGFGRCLGLPHPRGSCIYVW